MKTRVLSLALGVASAAAGAAGPYHVIEDCHDSNGATLCGLYRFFNYSSEAEQDCRTYAQDLGYPAEVCEFGTGGWYQGYWDAAWLCNEGAGGCTRTPYKKTSIFSTYCKRYGTDGSPGNEDLSKRVVPGRDRLSCYGVIDRYFPAPNRCEGNFGNPIRVLNGVKKEEVALTTSGALPGLSVVFDSSANVPLDGSSLHPLVALPYSFGGTWQSSMHRRLQTFSRSGIDHAVSVVRGGQAWIGFVRDGAGNYSAEAAQDWRLVRLNGTGWRLTDAGGAAMESYDSAGRLTRATTASGAWQSFSYNTAIIAGQAPVVGLLIGATDQAGRATRFFYESVSGGGARIYKVVSPDDAEILVGYDGVNNLATLTWPDGKVKKFVYERADLPWALTGIIDEDNKRYARFDYDAQGRAFSTEHAGGVDKYLASWSDAPRWTITDTYDATLGVTWRDHAWTLPVGTQVEDPLGTRIDLGAHLIHGSPRQVERSQGAGSGCAASESSATHDSRGNVTSKVDFNAVRSCHAYMADRGVETFRVEGLDKADACPADLASYQVPGGLPADKPQRKISTKWHLLWNLEARRAEPKRIVTTVYNGEPDPLNNNVVATCASGDPRLPDNNRIAVVCTRYEQSTDDETGNLGFDAPVKETRKSSFTYGQDGQVLTETDPRGKVTTYEYWTDTAFTGSGNAARGHQLGDLKRVTNALGQQTNFLEYNKRGQVLTTQFANGSQEQREYHVRGWLTQSTLMPAGGGAGQVTQYNYYDTGLLKKVTQPDGSFAKYTWDDAHRLTDVTDSVGNTVHYELDNLGNRTAEKFKDPQGALAKTITRTFDALGRMSSSAGLR